MKKILVIDDEESIRLNIELVLSHEGFSPVLARNGAEGIEKAKHEVPDLILCDVLMPDCSGFSVLDAVKNYQPTSLIPFIFLTGKTEKEDIRRGMLSGVDDYIPKPFDISELVQTVRTQLKKYDKILEETENLRWESQESFSTIFKYAPVGIALISSSGNILKVNEPYCDILKYSSDELYKMNLCDFVFPEDYKNTVLMNNRVADKEISHYILEKRYIRKDGNIIWVNISVSGVYKKNKALSCFISMIQDISERKKSEMESLKAERLLTIGKMSAMLTHEIKTPLTSIRMNVEMLNLNEQLTENNKKSLNIIKKETKRLTNLVKDVLQFSNQMDVVKTEFELRKIFDELIFTFDPLLKPLNITIINSVERVVFTGDMEKLISAFMALINNSVEAITSDGIIEFSSKVNSDENLLTVYIRDNGCGIKDKERIFEPFFTSKPAGTGLGLIIAQKIFQQHAGNIRLISSVPGETVFEITFSLRGENGNNFNN
jgi:PAS domain S-box-containing protein